MSRPIKPIWSFGQPVVTGIDFPYIRSSYTITNTPNTHKKWDVDSVSGDWNVGDLITGRTSGAKGQVLYISTGFTGDLNGIWFVVLSGTFTPTGEIVDFSSGGQATLDAGGESDSSDINTIWVTGSQETDSTSDLVTGIGATGDYGAVLSGTTLNEFVDATETAIDVVNATNIKVGQWILIDDEIMQVTNKAGNTLTTSRGWWGTEKAEHTNGTIVYMLGLEVTDADADLDVGGVIKIDSEYMLVLYSDATNNFLYCLRGYAGSTIATHTATTSIYNVDDALFSAIYDADQANGWGYSSLVNGRYYFDCQIYLGDVEQTARTVCITKNETMICEGSLIVCGTASYESMLMSGRGQIGRPEFIAEGSTIRCMGQLFDTAGICPTIHGHMIAFSTQVARITGYDNLSVERLTATPIKRPDDTYETTMVNQFSFGAPSGNTLHWRDVLASLGSINPASAAILFDQIRAGGQSYGLYFLNSGQANPEIYDLSLLSAPAEAFSFVDGGNKYIINPGAVNLSVWSGFWATTFYYEQYTVDINITNEEGTALEDVRIRCWSQDQDILVDSPVFDELTDSSGDIDQQIITRKYKPNAGATTTYEPFTFLITKIGWADEKIVVDTVEEQIEWNLTLKNVKRKLVGD